LFVVILGLMLTASSAQSPSPSRTREHGTVNINDIVSVEPAIVGRYQLYAAGSNFMYRIDTVTGRTWMCVHLNQNWTEIFEEGQAPPAK
jgi:hypothetical protein